ncbi:hypothetical protein DXG03_003414 [Asterophora parasitica]|uniref:C2H2-type domain-containing protein n=1 Tax=Asterophora parasitica TaxID=117018 RepID=A0A9P7G4Z5_9AGAR|nr:hypothetical protein DXG03_003414 [Asterophora parasitica]
MGYPRHNSSRIDRRHEARHSPYPRPPSERHHSRVSVSPSRSPSPVQHDARSPESLSSSDDEGDHHEGPAISNSAWQSSRGPSSSSHVYQPLYSQPYRLPQAYPDRRDASPPRRPTQHYVNNSSERPQQQHNDRPRSPPHPSPHYNYSYPSSNHHQAPPARGYQERRSPSPPRGRRSTPSTVTRSAQTSPVRVSPVASARPSPCIRQLTPTRYRHSEGDGQHWREEMKQQDRDSHPVEEGREREPERDRDGGDKGKERERERGAEQKRKVGSSWEKEKKMDIPRVPSPPASLSRPFALREPPPSLTYSMYSSAPLPAPPSKAKARGRPWNPTSPLGYAYPPASMSASAALSLPVSQPSASSSKPAAKRGRPRRPSPSISSAPRVASRASTPVAGPSSLSRSVQGDDESDEEDGSDEDEEDQLVDDDDDEDGRPSGSESEKDEAYAPYRRATTSASASFKRPASARQPRAKAQPRKTQSQAKQPRPRPQVVSRNIPSTSRPNAPVSAPATLTTTFRITTPHMLASGTPPDIAMGERPAIPSFKRGGKTRYSCLYCEMDFTRRNDAYRHMMGKHGLILPGVNIQGGNGDGEGAVVPGERFVCVCGRGLSRADALARHKRTCVECGGGKGGSVSASGKPVARKMGKGRWKGKIASGGSANGKVPVKDEEDEGAMEEETDVESEERSLRGVGSDVEMGEPAEPVA